MRGLPVALCLVAALLCGGRAEAHAALVAAEPAAGSVLAAAPDAARLSFSEPVTPLAARWFRADAAPVDAAPRLDGARLVVPLPPGPLTGTLLLSWRVVSGDGHPIGGSHAFSVGAPSAVAPAPSVGAAWPAAIAQAALTLALVFGVGGAVFLRLVGADPPPPRARTLALAAALAAAPVALLACGLHGLDLTGAPPAGLLGVEPWRAAFAGPFAAKALASGLAGLLAACALRRGAGAGLALAAWALAAGAFALFGHAASAPPRWLAASATALHAAAVLFWIGALPGLLEGLGAPRARLTQVLGRFSRLAVGLVALLLASGAALALIQLETPSALVRTAYGRLLLVKLAAVALLLAFAAHNRLRVTPAIAAGRAGAPARLRRSVLAEIGLGLLILGLASGFRLTPPPRTAAAAASVHARLHGPALRAEVLLRPGRAGSNDVEITLISPAGDALDPQEVRIAFADPLGGVEPIRLLATGARATWRAGPLPLPHAAEWSVTLSVLVDAFSEQTLRGAVDVGGPAGVSPP